MIENNMEKLSKDECGKKRIQLTTNRRKNKDGENLCENPDL